MCISNTVMAAEAVMPEQVLEVFFQLGLPDTSGAKWVQVYGENLPYYPTLPQLPNGDYTGNAWLLREEADGRVELVLPHGLRVHGRRSDRVNPDAGTKKEMLPLVDIQPANLDKDIHALKSVLQTKAQDSDSEEDDYRLVNRRTEYGVTLLLLAHLQRQERIDSVRTLLPVLLALETSPEIILDSAVSLLADGRMAQCTHEWTESGDAAAYAKGLEQLTAKFSRGWQNRDAVSLLLGKVRSQTPSPSTKDPQIEQAAELLLNLTPLQLRDLPRETNWLLESGDGTIRAHQESFEVDFSEAVTEEPTRSIPANNIPEGDPVTAFFRQKSKAAKALAHLLDDKRFLRVPRSEGSNSHAYFSLNEEMNTDADSAIRASYQLLPRPYELGELAWELLLPILPDELRSNFETTPANKNARVLAWLEEILDWDNEQIAWHYMRESSGVHDNNFRASITYLIQHGGAETQSKLQEVFLDPVLWNGGWIDSASVLLEPFLKRMTAEKGDVAGFGERLKVVVTKAIEAEGNANSEFEFSAEILKEVQAQRSAQIKKLEQILKPQRLEDLLAELAAVETPEETKAVLEVIGNAIATTPWIQVEPAIYQAAAQTKSSSIKRRLLETAMLPVMRQYGRPPGNPESNSLSFDAATSDALKQLLKGEVLPNDDDEHLGAAPNITYLTGMLLVLPRLSQEEQSSLMGLMEKSAYAGFNALRQRACALISGEPIPALPDASNVPETERRTIIQKLSTLPADQINKVLRTKTLDQQLAVVQHLAESPEWPATIRDAHLTVTRVRANDDQTAILKANEWRGKRFDAGMRREITVAVEKAAQEGMRIIVKLSARRLLEGLTLSIEDSSIDSAPEMVKANIPDIDVENSLPVATILHTLQLNRRNAAPEMAYWSPVWEDPSLTQAWKQEHLSSAGTNALTESSSEVEETAPKHGRVSPRTFETRLQEIFDLKPSAQDSFTILWHAMKVRQSTGESEEAEAEN